MSGSIQKDRVSVMAIHTTPPHLTQKDFETKLEAFVDSLLAVPAAQKNILKAEMYFQNQELNESFQALGWNVPQRGACVIAYELESQDNIDQIYEDPEFRKVYDGGADIGFHARGCCFTADVVHMHDVSNGTARAERRYAIGVYKFPSHELLAEFQQRIAGAAALAATHKHIVKSSAWVPNQNMENYLREFGRPPTEPNAVILAEGETWEQLKRGKSGSFEMLIGA
ncbi:hypothetical protein MVEN_00898900 [Mycena venus]|uniref:Uncharacterized protein n=1 Tax=Mycena venus TaxID=2733690 RepID=A0A8H6YGC3_9AGAR|nr:hypothetical protein MVEN_00898900 [Mycena venus]